MLSGLPENSVDTVITDPPYGLEFMGKDWDHGVPGERFWREIARVAKPGAMLMAFGGTRTHHRLMVAIEDAGWELKDVCMWLYGQGFPKSRRLDLSASRCLPEDAFCQCDASTHSNGHTYPVRNVLDRIRKVGLSLGEADDSLPNALCDLDIPEDSLRDYQPGRHSDGGPLHRAAGDALAFALLSEYAQEHIHYDVPLDGRVVESIRSLCRVLCNDLPSMRDYLHPSSSQHVSRLLRAYEDGRFRAVDLSMRVSSMAGSLDVQALMDADISASRRPHIRSLVFCLPLSFSRMLCSPKANTIIPQSEYCTGCGGIRNKWSGWGSCGLKPAWEPIIVAENPRDKTYANNALKWGVSGIWVDGGRISTNGEELSCSTAAPYHSRNGEQGRTWNPTSTPGMKREQHPKGRWPANLILSHHEQCVRRGGKEVEGVTGGGGTKTPGQHGIYGTFKGHHYEGKLGYADGNGKETVADWDCHPDCAVRMLAEQSGESVSRRAPRGGTSPNPMSWGDTRSDGDVPKGHSDHGTAARFFYTPKASKRERTCDGTVDNDHPTVKPLEVVQYLVRLTKTPTGGVVLDPFMGSGTTGVACIKEGRDFIGIDKSEHYCEIARQRIEYTKREHQQLEMSL